MFEIYIFKTFELFRAMSFLRGHMAQDLFVAGVQTPAGLNQFDLAFPCSLFINLAFKKEMDALLAG